MYSLKTEINMKVIVFL